MEMKPRGIITGPPKKTQKTVLVSMSMIPPIGMAVAAVATILQSLDRMRRVARIRVPIFGI
jgi:hypothetical protein